LNGSPILQVPETGETDMPITIPLSGAQSIDGILWGFAWDNPNLTYSFPTTTADYAYGAGISGFEAFNSFQKIMATKAIRNFDDVCGLKFTLTTVQGAGNIRFAEATTLNYFDGKPTHVPGNPPAPGTAEANPPDPTRIPDYAWGDCWFNHSYYNQTQLGSFMYAAGIMHELGHAVGLKHGHMAQTTHGTTFPTLPAAFNGQEFSIMTYNGSIGKQDGLRDTSDYPQTLMMLDIAALQYMYGADYTTRSTNTSYYFSPTDGVTYINGVSQGTPLHKKILMTIWDGGGVDTLNFSKYTTSAIIDLRPGFWSTPSNAQRAELAPDKFARGCIAMSLLFNNDARSLIENAIGGSAADRITGNGAANRLEGAGGNDTISSFSGSDVLLGGSGNDRLTGGSDRDTMYGGSGNDTFDFNSILDSRAFSSGRDVIVDFTSTDIIDLSTLDASTLSAGNQAFRFVVNFTGSAGQLQYDKVGVNQYVASADVNGDKVADFAIFIAGALSLSGADFIL
jgi:serralysin